MANNSNTSLNNSKSSPSPAIYVPSFKHMNGPINFSYTGNNILIIDFRGTAYVHKGI